MSKNKEIRDILFIRLKHCNKTAENITNELNKLPIPENLCQADPGNILINQVIWYPETNFRQKWTIVKSIIDRFSMCETFNSIDGERCGLKRAFVEFIPKPKPRLLRSIGCKNSEPMKNPLLLSCANCVFSHRSSAIECQNYRKDNKMESVFEV